MNKESNHILKFKVGLNAVRMSGVNSLVKKPIDIEFSNYEKTSGYCIVGAE